jgi:hypothetical protein
MHRKTLFAFCAILAVTFAARADNAVSVPNTFTAGTPAKAADVNANFTALVNGINNLVAPPTVVDSAGHVVGPYIRFNGGINGLEFEAVFIRTSTISFAVAFSIGGAPSGGGLLYTTADCSGTAYVEANGPQSIMMPYAMVLNTTAYVYRFWEVKLVSAASETILNGNSLQCTSLTPATVSAAPVVATIDLSTMGFVPPFSVR